MLSITPPKDLRSNLDWRTWVRGRGDASKRDRDRILEKCKHDIIFYTDSFVWQINPKHIGNEVGPFITWPFQERAIHEIIHRTEVLGDDILLEKSREMGGTWLALIIDDHGARFKRHRRYLHISHTEKAVDDKGKQGTLFAKLRFINSRLPEWLQMEVKATKLQIEYPKTDSEISGAATTERSGVGDRATRVLLDEFSKHQKASEILGQTADTGPRLFIGTHYGVGTEFYNLTLRPDMHKIVMHWTQHPEKNKGMYRYVEATGQIEVLDKGYEYPADFQFVYSEAPLGGPCPGIRSPWYDRECARRASPRDIAMHLDIDPQGSQSQFFNPLTIRNLIKQHATPPTEWDLSYDADSGRPIALTQREGGIIKLWITPISAHAMPPAPYACGNDIAAGMGATNSVASFGNAQTGEKVCEIATPNMKPEAFAALVVSMCRLFKDADDVPAKLIWETPGPGQTFGDIVGRLGYANIYYRESHSSGGGPTTAKIPGWNNSSNMAQNLLEHYRGALDSQTFINRSEPALEECLHYRYSGLTVEHPERTNAKDPSGARVNHGDRVMADALLSKMMRALQNPESLSTISSSEPEPWSLEWRRRKRKRAMAASEW